MFAWMVALMSVIVAALIVVWLLSPALRQRMEVPKFRMLERERHFRERNDAAVEASKLPAEHDEPEA